MTTGWSDDILGPGFSATDLPLGDDAEGPVSATLVRSLPSVRDWLGSGNLQDIDVLYVHGWSDYFFQKRLARVFTARGARFFALDLRKYGRSLREWQTPGYIEDLRSYDEDIAAALAVMQTKRRGRRLLLLGHSTGGLILSLWASRQLAAQDPDSDVPEIVALLLNSPWLEFQLTGISRQALTPLADLQARVSPHAKLPQVDLGFYSRAQREVAVLDDPIETNPAWRPERTMPVRHGWLAAIWRGQAAVAEGLGINIPIFMLLSARTARPTHWSVELLRADSVLTVDAIARASLSLGSCLTLQRIDGALHDVFLSAREPRDAAYAALSRFLDTL